MWYYESMDNEEPKKRINRITKESLSALQKDFVVMGKTRVSSWTAWLLIGVAVGVTAGILFVANQSGTFGAGLAAEQEPYEEYQPAQDALLGAKKSPEAMLVHESSARLTNLRMGVERGGDKPSALAELRKTARERRKTLEFLIDKDPATAFLAFLPPSLVDKFPREIQSDIERFVTLDAEIEILHVDDFDNQKAIYQYFLRTKDAVLEFHPIGSIGHMQSGTRVRLNGFQLGEKIVAPVSDSAFSVVAEPDRDTIGDQKLLVLLVAFLDSPPPPIGVSEIRDLVFNGQMQAFFREASYNKLSWSGDVIGWYTAPRNGLSASGACQWPTLGASPPDVDGLYGFIRGQVNFADYDRVLIIAHHPCMNWGMSTIGKHPLYLDGSTYSVSTSWVGISSA